MDAVFALQRSGSDAVFAYQFPVTATQATAGWGPWPDIRDRAPRGPSQRELELEAAEAQRQAERRAAEVSEAVIARAAAVEPAPEALARLTAPPVPLASLLAVNVEQTVVMPAAAVAPEAPAPSIAALDEDAILAASMLLMRRRLTR